MSELGAIASVTGISDAAYDKLHKQYRSHRAVFEAAAQFTTPRRNGLATLCRRNGIDPVAQ